MFILQAIGDFSRTIVPAACIVVVGSTIHAQSALPSDPTVVAGDIEFTLPNAGQLNIDQTSPTGIINWDSFSIGSGNTVAINNGNGATLNRVTGAEASKILGNLSATGTVYLLNQNGVFFGKDGVIYTGGDFVASTLDITNEDFQNGGDTVFQGNSSASVLNFGKIGSLGGDVALIARSVVNEGSISAPKGTAALVAGREILMRDIALDNGMFVVRIGGEDTSVTDKGSIAAATAELRANGGNIYALAGNTKGAIRATGVQKKGGKIFLTAGGGRVKTTKTISARHGSGAGGSIVINSAYIDAANLFDASASNGKGGFVELYATAEAAFSGQILAYGDDVPGMGGFAEVSGVQKLSYTGSTDTGGGTLLLDPNNIEITTNEAGTLVGSSLIDPAFLTNDLANQNVFVNTTGADGEAGTIFVDDPILYNSDFDLSLVAHGDLLIFSPIQNSATGGGDINLVSGWDGSTNAGIFDAAPFLSADIDNPTLFGNNTGTAYTLFGTNEIATGSTEIYADQTHSAVGSLSGDTNLFANDIRIIAMQPESGFSRTAMLGVRVNNTTIDGSVPITGNITARAAGSINLVGEQGDGGAAQIGHVGNAFNGGSFEVIAEASGDIFVEAAGEITLEAGESRGAYALIGHGSVNSCAPVSCDQSQGARQGNIDVFAGGELSLDDGFNSFGSPPHEVLAWIGHGTATPGGITNSNIDIEANSFDQSAFTNIAPGASGSFNPNIINSALTDGAFTLVANNTGLAFGNDTDIFATDGSLVIAVDGNLQFGSGSTIFDNGVNGQYAFSAGGDIFLLPGEDLFDIGSGTWFVYSSRPDQNTGDINSVGGLGTSNLGNLVYDGSIDLDDPFLSTFEDDEGNPLDNTFNTLIYSAVLGLTIEPLSYVYGQDSDASASYTFTIDGVEEDPTDFGLTDITFQPNASVVTLSPSDFVNAGTYIDGVESLFDGDFESLFFTADDLGDLTVTPAPLTVALADEVKEGTGYTGLVTFTGFVSGEDDTLITSGPTFSYSGNDGSDGLTPGDYIVGGSGSTESSGNYVFDETDLASLTILEGDVTGPQPEPEPSPTEEPTVDIPELPRDQNPSTTSNQAITAPILVNGTDGFGGDGFLEVSTLNTDRLVNQLQRGKQFCEGLAQQEYVIDCMGDSMQKAAEGLPEGGDYAAVRAALEEASAKLATLARQNASTTLTRGLVQANGRQSPRRFTPVATEALAALNAQASAIIEEAQTVLLRSAQNSERRKVHYQRIAEAVGSNKILLRS